MNEKEIAQIKKGYILAASAYFKDNMRKTVIMDNFIFFIFKFLLKEIMYKWKQNKKKILFASIFMILIANIFGNIYLEKYDNKINVIFAIVILFIFLLIKIFEKIKKP